MHMEHTIAKDAFSGLSGNNAVYNAICIAVCDDEQFMCDMIEEKIKEMLPDAVVCKFFFFFLLLDSETQIDILFLDIQMPEMDGIEALKGIKGIDANAKVVMCSAMGQQGMVMDAIRAGAADFIVKPFDTDRVIKALDKVI